MTRAQFLRLGAYRRGYAVYMLGSRTDVPGIPDESNPFPLGSRKWSEWALGQQAAMMAVIDCDED